MGASVKDVMTARPRAVTRETPVSKVAELMESEDVGAIPVVDGDRLLGMITDRDIAMAAYTQGRMLRDMTVASAMSRDLQSARSSTPLDEVERVMRRHQIRRVPVVDEHGRPVGMISLNDMARRVNEPNATMSAAEVATTLKAVCLPRRGSGTFAAAE
jgi:CBS domain-containing protein